MRAAGRATIVLSAVAAFSAMAVGQPMVAEGRATHVALIGPEDDPVAEARFRLDPQNNTLSWTIEFDRTDITGLTAACFATGEDVVLPPPEPADMRPDELVGHADVIVLAESADLGGPVEGQLSDLTQDLYDLIAGEQCYVRITTDGDAQFYGRIVRAPETAASGGGVAAPEVATLEPEEIAALVEEGEEVFDRRCAACHGGDGGGGEGPALAGNDRLASRSAVLSQILLGGAYMPPFGTVLSDHEVAAVATFIRNSFGNAFGPITEDQVAAAR